MPSRKSTSSVLKSFEMGQTKPLGEVAEKEMGFHAGMKRRDRREA
jgi:hypothetical protein